MLAPWLRQQFTPSVQLKIMRAEECHFIKTQLNLSLIYNKQGLDAYYVWKDIGTHLPSAAVASLRFSHDPAFNEATWPMHFPE